MSELKSSTKYEVTNCFVQDMAIPHTKVLQTDNDAILNKYNAEVKAEEDDVHKIKLYSKTFKEGVYEGLRLGKVILKDVLKTQSEVEK